LVHPTPSSLSSALAGWGNDDLLISDSSQRELEDFDPALFALLNWPELRAVFLRHDPPSNASRKQLRFWGKAVFVTVLLGLAAGIAGHLLAARDILKTLTLAATAIAGALGLAVALGNPARKRWLANRIWTERLRQLNFQMLINHLPEAAAALAEEGRRTDPQAPSGPALQAWHALRSRALKRLEAQLSDDEDHAIDQLACDRAEINFWLQSEWQAPVVPASFSPEAERLIELLGTQRIGIQLEYVQKKLREGPSSPGTQRNWIKMLALLFSVLAVTVGLAAIPLIALDPARWLTPMIVAQAVCGSVVVLVNAFDKGLAITEDADRYEWYLAALEHLRANFTHAQHTSGKIDALRGLEMASYVEMRRFFVSHKSVRSFG
jgi:hypothetical protein